MRVIYFHQHFSTPEGAAGIRSYAMAKALIERDHEVIMVCGSHQNCESGLEGPFIKGQRRGLVEGIDIIELDIPYSNSMNFLQRSFIFLKYSVACTIIALKEDYDLVFCTSTPLTASIPGIISKYLRRKTFVFEVRDLWPELPKAMQVIKNRLILISLRVLEFIAYKSADSLVALSPGIRDGIIRNDIDPSKVAMIPNGCDINIFFDKKEIWQPNEISDSDFVALYSGTHGIANGLEFLIEAACDLRKKKIDNIKFVLIGSGLLKQQLKSAAEENNLTNIVFLDPVEKRQLAALMNRSNIGLQLLKNIPEFYYGTSPNKFFDYISSGLPVLVNYPGWIADLVTEFNCGGVSIPDSTSSFVEVLIDLSRDEEKLFEMSDKSHLLSSSFDRSKLSNEFSKWIEKTYEVAGN
jgi:glycosyltransferase involved in cell wall biosynthesis